MTPEQQLPVPNHQDQISGYRRPLGKFEVYVDDFCGAAQGGPRRRRRIRRVLFDTLDRVLRPLDPNDTPYRQEPASIKKLKKGDGAWSTRKIILGWLIDTMASTLELPQHRRERLSELLAEIPSTQKRVSIRKWHGLLGELRSMTLALPGARGLFSHIQNALWQPIKGRIRTTRHVHDTLNDFRWLADNLAQRPTRLPELVAADPVIHGTTDACGKGMGGVMLEPAEGLRHRALPGAGRPVVWRTRFPPTITADLVSYENPHGSTTNSDLELAATVLQHEVIANHYDIRERTTHTATDNTPALSWQHRGSVSTNTVPAYLLRLQALHQRYHRYVATYSYLPGPTNVMSDDASRLWHLSDNELLTHFDSTYPQPHSWVLYQPPLHMTSAVISALHKRRPMPESFLHAPPPLSDTGKSGLTSVGRSNWIQPFRRSKILPPSFKSMPSDTAPANLPPAVTQSDLEQWRTRYAPLGRRLRQWGPTTLA